jgi:hypothetical protein
MQINLREEICVFCNETTGKAGHGDGSIYCLLLGDFELYYRGEEVGPLCPECYHGLQMLKLVGE